MQTIDIGYASVRASRMTYVGELGWELYVPMEMADYVVSALVFILYPPCMFYPFLMLASPTLTIKMGELFASGHVHGLGHAGYYALESLRVEKVALVYFHPPLPSPFPPFSFPTTHKGCMGLTPGLPCMGS